MLNTITALAALLTPIEAETVPLPVRLPESAHIELMLTKSDRSDGGEWRQTDFRYDVILEAPDEDDMRTMTWRLQEVNSGDAGAFSLSDFDVVMTVDVNLTPIRVENFEAILVALRRVMEASGEHGLESGMAALAAMTPEGAALFARDATLIAQGQGTELYVGQDHMYEVEGALPWGGGSMTMLGIYRLENVDVAAGRAVVRWEMTIDPESLLAVLPSMTSALMSAGNADEEEQEDVLADMDEAIAGARLENRRECDYVIDLATGLAVEIDCVFRVLIEAGGERRERESLVRATQTLIR
ncbi:MAG: hypothetical protein ACK4FB_07155 [Brevundimonas sp.]|uniref:hypothetical protein n=1 Tax=Brevundimonas sp. TaxID=1871086 RepID=UPI00391D22CF